MCSPEESSNDDKKKTHLARGTTSATVVGNGNNSRPSSPPTPQPSSPPSSTKNTRIMQHNVNNKSNMNNAPSMPVVATTTTTTTTDAVASSSSSSRRVLRRQSTSFVEVGFHFSIGSVISYLTVLFSIYFPFILAPWAASQTYHPAFFQYNANLSHFDNTIWTYGTDYLLAICMFFLAKSINYTTPTTTTTPPSNRNRMMTSSSSSSSFVENDEDVLIANNNNDIVVGRVYHKWWSRALLYSYMISVLAGGLAHQFFLTPASQNSILFRILWTICVGTVTAASGFMGAIGAELVKQDAAILTILHHHHHHGHYHHHHDGKQGRRRRAQAATAVGGGGDGRSRRWDNSSSMVTSMLPHLPEVFWIGFGVLATSVVIRGGFSFQRPACDIFIAGITQFPSTFYLMYIFMFGLKNSMPRIQPWARLVGVLGFILNAPLLPMYPLLVQYTDWTLASVNTLLHSWLLVAWTMQGIALRHVGRALQVAAQDLHQQQQQNESSDGASPSSLSSLWLSSSALATTKVDKPKVS
jgi:hypothetical protein